MASPLINALKNLGSATKELPKNAMHGGTGITGRIGGAVFNGAQRVIAAPIHAASFMIRRFPVLSTFTGAGTAYFMLKGQEKDVAPVAAQPNPLIMETEAALQQTAAMQAQLGILPGSGPAMAAPIPETIPYDPRMMQASPQISAQSEYRGAALSPQQLAELENISPPAR